MSLLLALCVGGCKSEEETKPEATTPAGEAAEPEAPPAPAAKAGDEGGIEVEPETPPATDTSPALAAAVQAIVEEEASYPMELDALLELVPAGCDELVVVRDVDDLLAVGDATLVAIGPVLQRIAAAAEADGEAGSKAEVDRVLDGYEAVELALHGPELSADKGIVIADMGDEDVVIFGSSNPEALPALMRSLGAEPDDVPKHCKAVDAAPGYVMCSDGEELLTKYAPGKDAAGLRAKVAEHVSTAVIDDANVLMLMGNDSGKKGVVAIATPPGLVHITVGLPELPEGAAKVLGSGPSPALGMSAPGSAFVWTQLDPAGIEEKAKEAPFMFHNVLAKLTGELFLGSLAEPNALVALAGVTDPGPAGGLVAMAGSQLDQLPKDLPDGTKLAAAMETVTVGGATTQAVHVTLTPAKGGELLAAMGLTPEGWLFAGGGYAGVVLGAGKDAVEKIGAYAGADLSPEVAGSLPKPLAQSLVDRSASVVMHMSLDGLQSPQVAEGLAVVAKEIPASELPPGITSEQMMSMARAVVAPISGLSMWMAPPKQSKEIHVAIALLGDPRGVEGKAAYEVMRAVAEGGDPAALYGDLATRYASSDRALAYQARAGTRMDGALASSAVLGVAAAVAIPAFLFYSLRSEESVTKVEAVPSVVR
ncbi:MAG: hypothetical protein KC501_01640 [Myxococcales bacterium]|nr:hypothetical protein [Myxococcales bacterium]